MGQTPSRRDFLKGLGAAGAGVVAGAAGAAAPGARAAGLPGQVPAVRPGRYARGAGGAPASSVDFGRIFPDLPPFAEPTTRFARRCSRSASRAGSWTQGISFGRTQGVDRRPDGERQPDRLEPIRHQPGQPDDDGGVDVRRPVHRSRHHVRSDLDAGDAAEPVALAQHAYAGAGSGLGVRRRTRPAAGPVRAERRRVGRPEAEARLRRRARGHPAGSRTRTGPTARCWAILATTRT